MTLPSSGSLSMSQINTEFGRGLDLNSYRGTQWVTPQGGAGAFTSSNIGFNQFLNTQPFWYFIGSLYYEYVPVRPFGGEGNFIRYTGNFYVGPHHCYGRGVVGEVFEWAMRINGNPAVTNIAFPNGRPSTFCRLHIHGIIDITSSSYDSRGGFFNFPNHPGTGWGNTTRTTEVFLFN